MEDFTMLILQSIKAKLQQLRFAYNTRRHILKQSKCTDEANHRVQVQEFNHQLCLSIDGIPVLPMDVFNVNTLENARTTLYQYLMTIR